MSAKLPALIQPSHYNIHYKRFDFVNFTFQGSVSIDCTAIACTRLVTLHALDLQILNATAATKNAVKKLYKAVEFHFKRNDQTCDILFDTDLQRGEEYTLSVDFVGTLNDQMRGLYRSTYMGLDGKTHVMATTQFEPTDARRALPCLDEPAAKATFCMVVTIPATLQCISNTPVASAISGDNGTTNTITFSKTPKMSTYLVALVVGQFDCVSETSNQIVTTVYTVPGKADQAGFCLDTAVRCLDLYQELFQVPYPLVKSDLVAIPDFAAGAMENWGCVCYREAKVLVKPGSTSESTLRGIARTLCHELGHMWFGNLVTPDFWTQLWLKEGAARFMEFVAVDKLFPTWDIWTEFVQSVFGIAQSLDSMQSSHPVEVEVQHPDDINAIFDAISYAKGASIIRMVAEYIGLDNFWKGMRIYLNRHAYGNAVSNECWMALEEASDKPIVKFMQPWTQKVGFPIILLKIGGAVLVERFLADGSDGLNTTAWPIPVTAIVEGIVDVQGPWVINGPEGDELEILRAKIDEWSSSGKWFKLNANQTAFCRVAYTKHQWKLLRKAMDPSGPLSAADRLGLISDSFAAGKSGYSSITDSLAFIESFASHKFAEYSVWQELSENLAGLAALFRSETYYPQLQTFIKKIYTPQFEILGWKATDGEAPRTGSLRATIISMLGTAGDERILKESYNSFMEYRHDPNESFLDGDMRSVIFECALRHNETIVFDELRRMYKDPNTLPEEQRDCLSVMGRVKDEKRHKDMLEYIFFSKNVRLQDISFPLASLAATSNHGGVATWKFFTTNFDVLRSQMGNAGNIWAACIGLACCGLRTSEDIDSVASFFETHSAGAGEKRLAQSMEVVRTKIARRERDRDNLAEFLNARP